MEWHMASQRRSDEDRIEKIKEEVGSRRGIVSTYRAQRGSIGDVQSFFSESDGPDLLPWISL